MSEKPIKTAKKKAAKVEKLAEPKAEKPPVMVKVRILKSRVHVGPAICSSPLVAVVTQAQAEYLESRKEAKIVGVA